MKYLWTTITVKDMDQSIEFYANMLGLQKLRRFPAGPGIEITFMGNGSDGETLVELLADQENSSVNYNEFVSLGFAVESLDGMLETIRKNNIPVHSGPTETPASKYFTIKDPNGLSIQFFQQK